MILMTNAPLKEFVPAKRTVGKTIKRKAKRGSNSLYLNSENAACNSEVEDVGKPFAASFFYYSIHTTGGGGKPKNHFFFAV